MEKEREGQNIKNKNQKMTNTIKSNNNNNINNNTDESWSASFKHTGNQQLITSDSSDNNNINSHNDKNDSRDETVHDSSLSIYERLRHFLYINFVLNKRSFVLSILSYLADLILFVALSLYLFSNKKFIYEYKCVPVTITSTSTYITNNIISTYSTSTSTSNPIFSNTNGRLIGKRNSNILLANDTTGPFNASSDTAASVDSVMSSNNSTQFIEMRQIKQSYLTLQIISFFVFFICFIFSYLIKLQFKYHRLALNLYDYDVENNFKSNTSQIANDRDGRESLASTTTASHFSSSANKKFSALVKRVLVRLLTKFASILLNLFFGYQFCQNCFIQQYSESYMDAYTIFTHIFIFVCVMFRCLISLLNKKNSMNKLIHLKKLQQKQKDLFDPANAKNPHRNYYFYYYSYLIKSTQNACNQLKQHQNNQNTFRIFQIDDMSLFAGFIGSLFHLFNFLKVKIFPFVLFFLQSKLGKTI